jgi:hypothetical protein
MAATLKPATFTVSEHTDLRERLRLPDGSTPSRSYIVRLAVSMLHASENLAATEAAS